MIRRILPLVAFLLFLVLAVDTITGFAKVQEAESIQLVAVENPSEADLILFQESGASAYASLSGPDGDFLVGEADEKELPELGSAGLRIRILSKNIEYKSYYIVLTKASLPMPDWDQYGVILLNDGYHVLLEVDSSAESKMESFSLPAQRLSMEPIVLSSENSSGRFPDTIEPDPAVQIMMDQVLSSTLHHYVGQLSGEEHVRDSDAPYLIETRYTYSGEPIQQAVSFVSDHLVDLNLDVEHQTWGGSGYPNVIGEMTGETHPEDIYLITAHLDSTVRSPENPYVNAPGADDNASGSAGVMTAADIFSQYRWGCTLRFAFFTGEEQGLYGSDAYSARAVSQGENIIGVLNMDMLGYNSPGSERRIDLEGSYNAAPASMDIAYLFAEIIADYSIDLIPDVVSGTCCSDHVPFLQDGIPAILAIEDFGDFNPAYHSTGDLLEIIDMDYYTDLVKASVGTFAHMSDCQVGFIDGYVRAEEDGDPISNANIKLSDADGGEFFTTTDSSGYYTAPIDVGTYTVTVTAASFVPTHTTNIDIAFMETTSHDFELVRADWFVYFPLVPSDDQFLTRGLIQ
ncbi:MAG: M28 family peptidase [Candidatus Promineifilaceae bacterium]